MSEKNDKKTTIPRLDSHRVWIVRIICCISGILLAGIILGTTLFVRIGKMSGWNMQGKRADVYTDGQIDKFITSVLITVQNQPMSQGIAPADMVFIASFNAFEQRLTMVSLADGLLAEVEGHGKKTLGETYALGGAELLIDTLNKNFNLGLHNYASTDTHSLALMLDLLGGVKTELTEDEAGYIAEALGEQAGAVQAGANTLSGVQGMVHALDNLSDDRPFGNLERRVALIHSVVFNMRKTATKDAMFPLLSLVFSNIQTNLSLATLQDCGYEILKAEEIEYRSLILPPAGSGEAGSQMSTEFSSDILRDGKLLREALYNTK